MADILDDLKERYRINSTAYQNPTGIIVTTTQRGAVAEIFMAKFNLSEDTLTHLQNGIDHLISLNAECHGKDKDGHTKDEWAEACCWFLFKHPRVFKAKWSGWVGSVFDILDEDEDGFINEDEFSFLYQSTCRRNDKAWISRAFKSIDLNNSGKVSRKQYVRAYVRYFTDPDIKYADLPLY